MNDTRDVVEQAALQLTQQVHARLSTIERFTGNTYSVARGDIMRAAVALVGQLDQPDSAAGQDRRVREQAARAVCDAMFGEAHPPAEFWATDLGQWVAMAIGYPRADITPSAAAAVLRWSRQNVWKQTSNGTIPLTPELLAHLVQEQARRRALALR